MFNAKNIQMIYGKPLSDPGRYANYEFPVLEKDSSDQIFDDLINEAKNKFEALTAEIKLHGGSNAREKKNQSNQLAIRSVFNNQFSGLLNLFSLNRTNLSEKKFYLIKKSFDDLSSKLSDLENFHKRNRPLFLVNYSLPLFAFIVDFLGKNKVSVNQIIAVSKNDLLDKQPSSLLFNQYLESQYSYSFSTNIFVQSVNLTVK